MRWHFVPWKLVDMLKTKDRSVGKSVVTEAFSM